MGLLDDLRGAGGGARHRQAQRPSAGHAGAGRAARRVGGPRAAEAGAGHQRFERLLIARGFAARALEIHRGYDRPLDLALFDPATGAAIAQIDPAVSIQQRYADFRFLDEGARKTDIQAPRPRRRQGPARAVAAELARVWRRRIVPAAQPVLNLGRPEAERIVFRRIAFDG